MTPGSEKVKAWRKQNPEKVRAMHQAWRDANRTLLRARARQRKYGITADEYQALFDAQGGRCAICSRKPGKRALSVDHDHDTGAVRGLLCVRCNTRLAALEDLEWLTSAQSYLRSR